MDLVLNSNLLSNINLIENKNISFINTTSLYNSIFTEYYGEMNNKFVLVRKFIYTEKDFLINLLEKLLKVVHPNIQIFYGLIVFSKENISINRNAPNVPLDQGFQCVLEYFDGIELCKYEFLTRFNNDTDECYFKFILMNRIAQTMSFLYKSDNPHLMLNGRNIKINHNLCKDFDKIEKLIYSVDRSSSIFSNVFKLTEIGSFCKYDKTYKIFDVYNEDIYEISFHSPELIEYFLNKEKLVIKNEIRFLEKIDVWSYGCILFELFTHKRPFFRIYGKKEVIETILNCRDNDNFYNKNKNEIDMIPNAEIRNLIKICTSNLQENRPNFEYIINIFSKNFPPQSNNNFSCKQDFCNYTQIDDRFNLSKYINQSITLNDEIIKIEKELLHIEKEYTRREKEIDHSNLEKLFYKSSCKDDNAGNFFIENLIFSSTNIDNNITIYIYNTYNELTSELDLYNDNNEDDNLCIRIKNFSSHFSVHKNKLFVSGGLINSNRIKENENLNKINHNKSYSFGYFFIEPTTENDFKIINKTSVVKINQSSNKLLRFSSIKRNVIKFSYNEHDKSEDLYNSGKKIQKLCYYTSNFLNSTIKKHLIKRHNHSVLEFNNYLFYIGGKETRKCEIFHLSDNSFYFIEELNTTHINPILYKKGCKIFSLNFEAIKNFYSNKKFNKHRYSLINETPKINKNETNNCRKSLDYGNLKHVDKKSDNIFCESFETNQLTSNPKWIVEEINFNLKENFPFEKFIYYKFLNIKDELIYIVGSDNICTPDNNNFKLYGVCFNIEKNEFTAMEKRTLDRLDSLKTSLAMNSNIIEYQNNFFYLNCVNKEVENLNYKFLMS